jgi:high-affinity Fe2+/Pb2+ permease
MQNKTKWVLQASLGLLLTGAGLSMAIDAGLIKFQGGNYFYYGTFALIVFQAGLCLVIDAPRHK